MSECVFCHKEQLVTDLLYEEQLVMAFMDMEPINEGHVLLVPKQHYRDVDEMPDGEEQDAYILGVDDAKEIFTGQIIAVVHRNDESMQQYQ